MASIYSPTKDRTSMSNTLRNSVENSILIWLDKNLNELSAETQNSIHMFQSYVNTLKIFSNPDEFQLFIHQISDEKLFVIISGSYGKSFVPEMDMNRHVYSIYVYCSQREHHEIWVKGFPKVKGVYVDLLSIRDALRRDVRQLNHDLIRIDILSNRKSNEFEQSFLCSLSLKEILLNSKVDEQRTKDFLEFSRRHYENNVAESMVIEQFEKDYSNQLSPIQWYTRECFIYSMIQRALRIYDIEILYKISFFISDLHRQIKDLHTQSTDRQKLTVYYGQGISIDRFEKFRLTTDDLISFNTFLLTTIDRKSSLHFAKQSSSDSRIIPILFQIEIDPTKSSFPFVVLDELDYYHDTDRHVLFSLSPTFRISHIEQLEDKLYQINLSLIDDNDDKLKDLTNSFQNKYDNLQEFTTLGRLMIKMNQFDKAKDVFQVLLKNTNGTDAKRLAYIHRCLGKIYERTKDFPTALSHYKTCLDIQSRDLPNNHSSMSSIYAHIGLIHNIQGNLDKALENFQRALNIAIHVDKPDTSIILTCLNRIGTVYISMEDYVNALQNLQKALNIQEKHGGAQANITADIHRNLSVVFRNLDRDEEADAHAAKAVNIPSHTDGRDHDTIKKQQH